MLPTKPEAPPASPAEAELPAEPEPTAEPEPAAEEELPARRAGEIGDVEPEEMQAAIRAAVPADAWTAHEDVLAAVARQLRFRQLWQGIRAPLERALHQAIRDGALEENASQELRRIDS